MSATSPDVVAPVERKPLVLIEWLDHCSNKGSSWYELSDIEQMQPLTVVSVGFILNETDTFVTIAAHAQASDDNYAGDICVIKAAIVDRYEINDPRPLG
jgi:hypothetical protein